MTLKLSAYTKLSCLVATLCVSYTLYANDVSDFAQAMIHDKSISLLAGPSAALGTKEPVWLSNTAFATLDEAVKEASNRFNPYSVREDREYIGIVLEYENPDNKHFLYTVSRGQAHQNTVPFRLVVPNGYRLAAFWHTHGSAHWSREYFSATDTSLAQRWNVPIYLANHTGALQIFRPDSRTFSRQWAKSRGLGRAAGIARGKQVIADDMPIRVATVL